MTRRTKAFIGIAVLAIVIAVLGTTTVVLATSSSSGTRQAAATPTTKKKSTPTTTQTTTPPRTTAAPQHSGSIGYVGPLSDDDGFNGGSSDGTTCVVNYDGKWYSVTVDRNGQWTGDNLNYLGQTNEATCADQNNEAAYDASKGYPWTTLSQYHPDTGVCVEGQHDRSNTPAD